MPNKRLRQIILVGQKRAFGVSEDDIRELERILGLAREEVVKRLDYLKNVEARYGAYGHAVLLRVTQNQLDSLDRMWDVLAATLAGIYVAGIDKSWGVGVEAGSKFGEHIGIPTGPVSRNALDIIRETTSDLAKNVSTELSRRIRGELVRGILNNDSIGDIANRLVGAGLDAHGTPWKSAMTRAKVIARTEVTRAYNQAIVERWRDEDAIVGWMWDAVMDMRTCEVCSSLHGRFWAKDDSSVMFPPRHPSCRCSILPVTAQYGKYEL